MTQSSVNYIRERERGRGGERREEKKRALSTRCIVKSYLYNNKTTPKPQVCRKFITSKSIRRARCQYIYITTLHMSEYVHSVLLHYRLRMQMRKEIISETIHTVKIMMLYHSFSWA